ncbi:hypothetical protein N7481_006134 [Penicillium waksmanii]|uniref:uncharacterized protein n=1 Tax=Penicillium waksmanii TaxID=69791 RepID=UPI002548AB48|nr:uncharacterized protein N7481_006134 [Penicillium waksmanii]KAJ5984035.1 hypothetical protein N7481_006134 [Penicillium waksmanii]
MDEAPPPYNAAIAPPMPPTMAPSMATPPPVHIQSSQSQALLVDFKWSKLKFIVSSEAERGEATPLYHVALQVVMAPHLRFKAIEGNGVEREVGTGTVHTFGISPDYELYGKPATLKAQKRFRTYYTHMSTVFSDTQEPVKMTWTSNTDFKGWDFICVDHNQVPVAKYSANLWAVKKFGKIELLGPKAFDPAARDEIVVLAVTLFYCMYLRVNNPFNLLGSAFMSKDKTEQSSSQSPQAEANSKEEREFLATSNANVQSKQKFREEGAIY